MLITIIPIINNRVREMAEFYKSIIEENCIGAVVVISEKYIEIEYQDSEYGVGVIGKILNVSSHEEIFTNGKLKRKIGILIQNIIFVVLLKSTKVKLQY